MARELFKVKDGERDLCPSHLLWVTNLYLLTLPVTVNKTDEARGSESVVSGAQQGLHVQHVTTLWMKRSKNGRNIPGVHIPVVISCLTKKPSAVTCGLGVLNLLKVCAFVHSVWAVVSDMTDSIR